MPKEKVTLTLDADTLAELRKLVGPRSLSAAVDEALASYTQRKRHLENVDEWLAELERLHGPTPVETLDWAARVMASWDKARKPTSKRRAG